MFRLSGFAPPKPAVISGLPCWLKILFAAMSLLGSGSSSLRAQTDQPCRLTVLDDQSGWPVPLVEFRTTNDIQYVTDNAGVIAIDDLSLMNREVWFHITGHGYGVEKDGFGYSGVRLIPRPGESLTVKVKRSCIARRIGRLTGAGLFAESQKLGDESEWRDGPVLGCDSVQTAVHRGKRFWVWGDTDIASYALGVFHSSGATTDLRLFDMRQPPLRPRFSYFMDKPDHPRALAQMPGKGPTWLSGIVSLPESGGHQHLVATYCKVEAPLDVYETGFCVWNDEKQSFDHHTTLWNKAGGSLRPRYDEGGHAVFHTDVSGKEWVLFGNPLPKYRFPATFEAWQNPSKWEILEPQEMLVSAANGETVQPHSGSIAFSAWRQKWVTVFMQHLGSPSAFGTLWYAESVSPTGPWGPAVQILTHDDYTFYNPLIHSGAVRDDEPILLFEGTYTDQFTKDARRTPRYDYNQILYRLNLDDPKLVPAHE